MENNWNRLAANILRAELRLRGLTYHELHQRLADLGVKESTNGIKAKINRGSFQFSFFLKCASAIGMDRLNLDSIFQKESN